MNEKHNETVTMPVIRSKTFRNYEDANKFADKVCGVVSVKFLVYGLDVKDYIVRWCA